MFISDLNDRKRSFQPLVRRYRVNTALLVTLLYIAVLNSYSDLKRARSISHSTVMLSLNLFKDLFKDYSSFSLSNIGLIHKESVDGRSLQQKHYE